MHYLKGKGQLVDGAHEPTGIALACKSCNAACRTGTGWADHADAFER